MCWDACSASPIAIVKLSSNKCKLLDIITAAQRGLRLKRTDLKKHAAARWGRDSLWLLAVAGLCSCVTINIYFPAAAAEKAADKVIDEIWQLPASTNPASPPPAVNQAPAP